MHTYQKRREEKKTKWRKMTEGKGCTKKEKHGNKKIIGNYFWYKIENENEQNIDEYVNYGLLVV